MSAQTSVMPVDKIRTGDVIVPPAVHSASTVIQVESWFDAIRLRLANGSVVDTPRRTRVKVRRNAREVNHDVPQVVFTSAL